MAPRLARRWSGRRGGVPLARLLAHEDGLADPGGRPLTSGVPPMRDQASVRREEISRLRGLRLRREGTGRQRTGDPYVAAPQDSLSGHARKSVATGGSFRKAELGEVDAIAGLINSWRGAKC